MDATDRGSRPPPSTPREPSPGSPSSDPSDPDGALYAAMRARPDWTEKPGAQAAIQELGAGLESGEDPLFWQVARPGDVKISDAKGHAAVVVLGVPEEEDGKRTGLESRRVYVAPGEDPRGAPTVRSAGRDRPARVHALPAVEATLLSKGAAPGAVAGGDAENGPQPIERERPRASSRGWLALPLAGAGMLGAALSLMRTITVLPPPARSASPCDATATARADSNSAPPPATAVSSLGPAPARASATAPPTVTTAGRGAKMRVVASATAPAAPIVDVESAPLVASPSVSTAPADTVAPAVRRGPKAPETQPDF